MSEHLIDFLGLPLEGPLMNAAGTCKTVDEVNKFASTPICAIVVGSYTFDGQLGNAGTTYYSDRIRSINSKGIPNGGRDYLRTHLPAMAQIAHDAGKALIVSISANTPDQFAELSSIVAASDADAIEINLACPNLWQEGTGAQKPIICFYPQMIDAVAVAVIRQLPRGYRLGWKLSVYSNPVDRSRFVGQLVEYPDTKFVTLTNTFPNAFGAFEDGKPWIGPEYGGMAGAALKPIALAHVRQIRREFPELPIIGAGGIQTGDDLRDYMREGATLAAVATAYFDAGLSVFSNILDRYTDLV